MSVHQPSLSPLGLYLQHFLRSPALSLHKSKRLTILDKNSPARSLCISDVLLTSFLPVASMLAVTIPPIIAQEESSAAESELERKSRPAPRCRKVSSVVDRRQLLTVVSRRRHGDRAGAPAAAQVHLYGVRARPEEKTSPERR